MIKYSGSSHCWILMDISLIPSLAACGAESCGHCEESFPTRQQCWHRFGTRNKNKSVLESATQKCIFSLKSNKNDVIKQLTMAIKQMQNTCRPKTSNMNNSDVDLFGRVPDAAFKNPHYIARNLVRMSMVHAETSLERFLWMKVIIGIWIHASLVFDQFWKCDIIHSTKKHPQGG